MNKTATCFAGILLLVCLSFQSCERKNLEGFRPNIVLVMTDDQGYPNLSCLGHPLLNTPHLDQLHGLSTRFVSFHVSPTCAPTRSAIMSGRHPFKNGVTHTIFERERMSLESTTIAGILRDGGYTTGIFGKWHLGDEDAYQPENRGFDEVFIHGAGGLGQAYNSSCADFPPNGNDEGRYFDPVIKHNGLAVKTKGFCTDVFFRQALGWIKQCSEGDKPFFAYISTNAPHGPYIAPGKYKKRFAGTDFYEMLEGAPEGYRKRFHEQGYDDNLAGYFGMIENIDDNMGMLMAKIREWGLEENTLVVFLSDNGQSAGHWIYNAGMKGNKNDVFEGGTRVPSFWYWKGRLAAGADIDRMAAHIDLFPTFAALAGVEIPEDVQDIDGVSLVPLLEDPRAEWEDRYIFFHRGRWKKGEDPDDHKYSTCAVRSQRFKLVNNTGLYDLENDPGETTDVSQRFPGVVTDMQKAYDLWWEEARPLMVNEDVPLSPVRPYFEMYHNQEREQGIPAWQEPEL